MGPRQQFKPESCCYCGSTDHTMQGCPKCTVCLEYGHKASDPGCPQFSAPDTKGKYFPIPQVDKPSYNQELQWSLHALDDFCSSEAAWANHAPPAGERKAFVPYRQHNLTDHYATETPQVHEPRPPRKISYALPCEGVESQYQGSYMGQEGYETQRMFTTPQHPIPECSNPLPIPRWDRGYPYLQRQDRAPPPPIGLKIMHHSMIMPQTSKGKAEKGKKLCLEETIQTCPKEITLQADNPKVHCKPPPPRYSGYNL